MSSEGGLQIESSPTTHLKPNLGVRSARRIGRAVIGSALLLERCRAIASTSSECGERKGVGAAFRLWALTKRAVEGR